MKILITGSSGFVGTHLCRKLSKKYEIVKFDIKDKQDVLNKRLLAKKMMGVDVVIHLAAFISAGESWNKPYAYLENNALGTLSVIKTAVKANVRRVIIFSSAAVKAKPATPYAVSKIAAEQIAKLYSDKTNILIIRPENIYGLGQKESYGYVIHSFINAVNSGESIKIFGTGKQSRDFIYIDDVVNTVSKLIHMGIKSGSVISLGTGKETAIKNLANVIMKVMGKKVGIEYLPKRKEPLKSVSNNSFLKNIGIDAFKFIKLQDGIKRITQV